MAANDLNITGVAGASGTLLYDHIPLGEGLAVGDFAYLKDGAYFGTDANDVDPVKSGTGGIALIAAAGATGDLVLAYTGGTGILKLTIGAGSVAEGKTYVLSDTPKKATLASDAVSGWHNTIVMIGRASNKVDVLFRASGQKIP